MNYLSWWRLHVSAGQDIEVVLDDGSRWGFVQFVIMNILNTMRCEPKCVLLNRKPSALMPPFQDDSSILCCVFALPPVDDGKVVFAYTCIDIYLTHSEQP